MCILQEQGYISELRCQPNYTLMDGCTSSEGGKVRPIVYRGDFSYIEKNGPLVVEDVKGVETPVFRVKEKLFKCRYPDVYLRILRYKDVVGK